MERLFPFLEALRLKTLPAAAVPVCLAASFAWDEGAFSLFSFLITLSCALCIQVATNLINDLVDAKKGTDRDRIGPLRVTNAGIFSEKEMRFFILFFMLLALFLGFLLVLQGGWPILLIGVLSLICAVWYSAGPAALAYTGLSDLFVLIFFGPVAVGGSYYLQTLDCPAAILLIGLGCGALSNAILVANNLRDRESDSRSNKLSLVVRFGESFGRREYLFCLALAAFCSLLASLIDSFQRPLWLGALFLLFAFPAFQISQQAQNAKEYMPLLPMTAKLLLLYGLLVTAGVLLP